MRDFEAIDVLKQSVKLFETEGWSTRDLYISESNRDRLNAAFARCGGPFKRFTEGYCALGAVAKAAVGDAQMGYVVERGSVQERALKALDKERSTSHSSASSEELSTRVLRYNDDLISKDKAVSWFERAIERLERD